MENDPTPARRDTTASDELWETLGAAERERERERKRAGRWISGFLLIPLALAGLWLFAVWYRAEKESTEPGPAASKPLPSERARTEEGGFVDKGDIRFAMELLNFGRSPDKPEPKAAGR